jgi:hypothetical protein
MDKIQEISEKILNESTGLSNNEFSIVPYQEELRSLDALDFVVWHTSYPQLYFFKLMHATAFVWKDLSWEQWQEGLLRISHDYQSLLNLSLFLTQFLAIDAFRTLREDLDIDQKMIDRLGIFFGKPYMRPFKKKRIYLSKLNEMNIGFAAISSRLYQQGAPKADLTDPKIIRP